ncbi:hypothetical protein [Azotobacter beijerinckii]|uniref:Uncharacterized protein n=1 Tax=Azotobacter beijerinckii TaxID=170623 RepID=A0A1I4C2A5_9GAMM|nr:hypothetical protein [Azotobacter beijerinckii]SFB58192.1 hypothetical protein SAMN04244571_03995 [Azotobacter beijerinckii]SFK75204.1 hypothetical protein SAMN04244574_01751 [Azotobacter beijerinckii]
MSVPNWNALLPSFEQIEAMPPEKLAAADAFTESSVKTIGFGIAAIGNLLAGAALNEDQGLDPAAVADLGWLLQSLGDLSAKLADTGYGIQERRQAIKRED